ncbi:hypothetical protein D3C78_912460 [compost metagenome]
MRDRRSARQRQTRHNRQNGGEGDSGDKAEEQVTAHGIGQMHRRHVVTANQRASGIFERRIRTHQHDRAKADNKGQDVEITHKTGGVKHAFTCFAGV